MTTQQLPCLPKSLDCDTARLQRWTIMSHASLWVCPTCGQTVEAFPLPYGINTLLCDICGDAMDPMGTVANA